MPEFTLSKDTISLLAAPLDQSIVKTRPQAGRDFRYIPTHCAIDNANRIFGYGGWTSDVREIHLTSTPSGDYYRCIVRVMAGGVYHDGIGFGQLQSDSLAGHETALKGAESDGLKRALVKFGTQFGNDLYDDVSASAYSGESRPVRASETELISDKQMKLIYYLGQEFGLDHDGTDSYVLKLMKKPLEELSRADASKAIDHLKERQASR